MKTNMKPYMNGHMKASRDASSAGGTRFPCTVAAPLWIVCPAIPHTAVRTV